MPVEPVLTHVEPLKNSQFTVEHPVPPAGVALRNTLPPAQTEPPADIDIVGSALTVITCVAEMAGFGLHPFPPQAYTAR